MVQVRPVLFVLGLLLCVLAASMLLPAIVDVSDGNSDWRTFLASSVFTFFVGGLLLVITYDDAPVRLGLKEGFLLTTATYVVIAAFASVPFVGLGLSYSDAYFEGMSGLTTTGSTVLVNLDRLPRGILLWRSLLQLVGGLGIVVTAIIILPFLRVGGMQLFQTESSERSEKIMPRAFELVTATAAIYLFFMVTCAILYAAFGMEYFDAICHAITTVATAGFSTHDESISWFKQPAIEWIAIVFMILGALPFVVYIRVLRGQSAMFWRDPQVRGLLAILLLVSLGMAMWLYSTRSIEFMEALRKATFNVTSIVTTTGYASDDYTKWGPLAVGTFLILTFIGGCAGSTSGGIKIYRLQVASLITRSHILHLMSPNRVVTLSYNGRRLPDDVPFSVVAFLAIYMTTVGMFCVALAAMGLDLVTAFSAAATAVSNVGPALGDIVGPSGNFSTLPQPAKWLLSFAMLLGRLELFTVLVLLRPEFWRR